MKLFEVTGVLEYAHVFSKEVEAETPEEAKKKVEKMFDDLEDPSMAEFQSGTIDAVEEVKK